ncbi:hypothetical protein TNCV_4554061 [Trichonephila clavipes]|nr:hypothetical protein TNCV_4554061 [Trichonephila clavipes]
MNPGSVYSIKMVTFVFGGIVVNAHWQHYLSSSYCTITWRDATRGLLVTDLIIWTHGQVTRTTPERAASSPNFHTTPMAGRLSSQ